MKGTPEQRAPWCNGLMLFSHKAKVMRMNLLDLIDILGDYVVIVYGIYYSNRYRDIPLWLQEDIREEISFFTVVCGIGLCPITNWKDVDACPWGPYMERRFKESISVVGRGIILHQK